MRQSWFRIRSPVIESTRIALSELTRERLYELVWSKPVSELAPALGVSGVAVAKRCAKLGVPRPGRGYWIQLEFGKKVKRPELPPTPPSPADVLVKRAMEPIPRSTRVQMGSEPTHPLAARFLAAINSGKLSYDRQRVHVRDRELPEAELSKAQSHRAAAAFQMLLEIVEPRGVNFRRALSSYEGGQFKIGHDRLYFKIEEELVDRPADSGQHRYSQGWRQAEKVVSGRLTFTTKPRFYGSQTERKWTESEKAPLSSIVPAMAQEICRHLSAARMKRQQEAIQHEKNMIEYQIRWQKFQEQEAIRRGEEAKRKHSEKLEQIARARQEYLLKAAELWRGWRELNAFVLECERRWRDAQAGSVSVEQQVWLAWAGEIVKQRYPFDTGYPDPTRDGPFDAGAVLIGGTYPELRGFSISSPVPATSSARASQPG